jgi:hypothetical protein
MALRGKARDEAKGGFLGGMRSARPQKRALRKPGHVIVTPGSARGPWPKGGNVVVGVAPSSGACRVRPSENWSGARKMVLLGKSSGEGGGRFFHWDGLNF